MLSGGERELAVLAAALIGDTRKLSVPERGLIADPPRLEDGLVAQVRAQILVGQEPLGTQFCLLRSAQRRRRLGATYTPAAIVEAMLGWAHSNGRPQRVVVPGAGSGRFVIAAAKKFPGAELVGVDIDPLATLMLRANAQVSGFAHRLTVHLGDYRELELAAIAGATLFIGNPPYVRHHDIAQPWKMWLATTANGLGFQASKLAGLHVHFFFKTRQLARAGDYGAFITAAEWLEVNYGRALRELVADGLGGTAVHIIDPKIQPFPGTLATGAITCFCVGMRRSAIAIRRIDSLAQLTPLGRGRRITRRQIAAAPKWTTFIRPPRRVGHGFIELGELFRVHRGQVTGGNAVWIESESTPPVPRRFRLPAVTSARDLLAAGEALTSTRGLRRVIDLPAELDRLADDEQAMVQRFLAWARRHDAHQSYIARHRSVWWAVGLRAPAPILSTYMARQAPVFVRNAAKARHINIAHGLYPREPLSDAAIAAVLAYLRQHTSTSGGRIYAGGLVKFEPKELERLLLPSLEEIVEMAKAAVQLGRISAEGA